MKELDNLCEEIQKEVTPKNIAKMYKEYNSLPEGILKDSIALSLNSVRKVIEREAE